MATFTDKDVIRIYVEHLDVLEQERVEKYFRNLVPDAPPPQVPDTAHLRFGLFHLNTADSYYRGGPNQSGIDGPLQILLAHGRYYGNAYIQFIRDWDINDFIADYKSFYNNIQEWEDELNLILNIVGTNPIVRLFKAAGAVQRLFDVLEGINSWLNAIQLAEDLAEDVLKLENDWLTFANAYEAARDQIGWHEQVDWFDEASGITFRTQVWPGTNDPILWDGTTPVGKPHRID